MKNPENSQTQLPGAYPGMWENRSATRPHSMYGCRNVLASRLGTRRAIECGVRGPLLHRRFLDEMINPGRARVDLSTADRGG